MRTRHQLSSGWLLALGLLACSGCMSFRTVHPEPTPLAGVAPPRELAKVSLPPYVISPPDVLLIDAVRVVPKSPYRLQSLDLLQINVQGTFQDQPITGIYALEPGGSVNLGPSYGSVRLIGLTVEEASDAIDRQLRRILRAPQVSVTLSQTAGQQQIQGEHLVGPDGTVNLGVYGNVYVAGMNLATARATIEAHLAQFLENPQVGVDVFAFNSKVYYVVTEGAGFGDNINRFPITGNETVLDALSQVNGRSRLSSKKIWIARPAPGQQGCDQILPVSWDDITKGAATATNYQILPGDRVFIAEDRLIAIDSAIARFTAPFERIFGFTLLGTQAVQTINRLPDGQGIR